MAKLCTGGTLSNIYIFIQSNYKYDYKEKNDSLHTPILWGVINGNLVRPGLIHLGFY